MSKNTIIFFLIGVIAILGGILVFSTTKIILDFNQGF
jgi:hypothetical protein